MVNYLFENIFVMRISETQLKKLIKEQVEETLLEFENKRKEQDEIERQIAREILGTDSFDEFYGNTGYFVGARDFAKMQEFFRRLKEIAKQREEKEKPRRLSTKF